MKATEVTAGLAESNGSLLPGLWPDSLHVTCGLTACTPGSAPGPTLGNEYGVWVNFTFFTPHKLPISSAAVEACKSRPLRLIIDIHTSETADVIDIESGRASGLQKNG